MGILQNIKNMFKPVPESTPVQKTRQAIFGRQNNGSFSGGAKYSYGLSGDGQSYSLNHYRVRQNARAASQDSVPARALLTRFADSVVDTGLKLEPTPDFNILGITPDQARQWSADVESRFNMWAMGKKSDRSEINNFYQNQHLYQFFSDRDGEVFTRLYYANDTDIINPLQIQFLDPNQIRGYAHTDSTYQYNNDDGIERDSRGREKAYKVFIRDEKFQYKEIKIPRVGVRSKRVFMLHGFAPEYAGQQRGFSPFAHCLQEFQNLTDFSLAKIKKAINQANMLMYVKPSPDNSASNPFEDLTTTPAGKKVDMYSKTPTAEEIADANQALVEYCAINEADMQKPGSVGIFNLNEGEDLSLFEDKVAIDSYENFANAFMSHLSASLGMPLEMLLMKFNANYSASRASIVLFWRICQIRQSELNADFNNPVYESWLSEEIASGRIKAQGWKDPVLKNAWLKCNWIGAPMINIDPGKEAKAAKDYMSMNLTTAKREARNHNGSNIDANIAENAKVFPEMAIPYWENQQQQKPEENQEQETEIEPEEEEESIEGESE